MIRIAISAALAVSALPSAAFGAEPAKPVAAPVPPKYSTSETDIGTLIDDPAAKAIVDKYIPGMLNSDQIDMARAMTLRAIKDYAPADVTDERLAKIDAELAKLN